MAISICKLKIRIFCLFAVSIPLVGSHENKNISIVCAFVFLLSNVYCEDEEKIWWWWCSCLVADKGLYNLIYMQEEETIRAHIWMDQRNTQRCVWKFISESIEVFASPSFRRLAVCYFDWNEWKIKRIYNLDGEQYILISTFCYSSPFNTCKHFLCVQLSSLEMDFVLRSKWTTKKKNAFWCSKITSSRYDWQNYISFCQHHLAFGAIRRCNGDV